MGTGGWHFGGVPKPNEPHKIEDDLKNTVEWTDADARFYERHAAFNEFYAEWERRRDASP